MKKYLFFLLILNCTNTFAEIIKWVDSNGQVHYSDQRPPPDVQQKTLGSVEDNQTSQDASSVAAPKTIAEREMDLKKAEIAQKQAADKAAQKQAVTAAQQANCANAQQNLSTLQTGIRLMETDANGQLGYIDDNQRAQRIAQAQNDISANCK